MYKVKTQMKRMIVVFFICVGYLFSSGCVNVMHGLTHPHSEITAPTFCIYDGHWNDQESKPLAIYHILVGRGKKINDERIDWSKWHIFSPIRTGADQVTWEMEYDPDGKSDPPSKPLSCLTYGKVPPGYIETIPAQPLIPERVYTVIVRPKGGMPNLDVYFIIRADSTGRPTQLEYTIQPTRLDQIHIINRE